MQQYFQPHGYKVFHFSPKYHNDKTGGKFPALQTSFEFYCRLLLFTSLSEKCCDVAKLRIAVLLRSGFYFISVNVIVSLNYGGYRPCSSESTCIYILSIPSIMQQ
jgi:hypothetical protein